MDTPHVRLVASVGVGGLLVSDICSTCIHHELFFPCLLINTAASAGKVEVVKRLLSEVYACVRVLHACMLVHYTLRSFRSWPTRALNHWAAPATLRWFFSSGIHTPQGANARLTNTSKRRALHYHKGNVEIINALLKHTTDVDAQVLIGVQHAVQQNLMFNLAEMTDRRVS